MSDPRLFWKGPPLRVTIDIMRVPALLLLAVCLGCSGATDARVPSFEGVWKRTALYPPGDPSLSTGTFESTFELRVTGDSVHGSLVQMATVRGVEQPFLVGGHGLRGKVTGTQLVYQQFFNGLWRDGEFRLALEGGRLRESGTDRYYLRVSGS